MALKSKIFDGKKFMWDGKSYQTEDKARQAENAYKEDGFETRSTAEDDHYSVYTRRIVTEIVLEGEAPI